MRTLRLRTLALSLILLALVALASYAADTQQPMVSNVFDNTFLIDALRDISTQTGVGIVADSTVTGQVTITLDNVPFEEALTRLLAPGGYVYKKIDGYYLVGAPDPKNPSFLLLSSTAVVKLKHVKALTAANALAELLRQYVKVDEGNNIIVITAPDVILNRIKADLVLIDRQVPQVMLEALVVDVTKNGRKDLGLDWRWEHNSTASPLISESGSIQLLDLGLDLAYVASGGIDKFLTALRATVENGDARVEANPRIMTLDGQVAEIFVGRERYYEISTADGDENSSTRLESIKTGITLRFLPQVGENGVITIKIEPEVSDVVSEGTSNGGTLPVVSRRRVSTTVRVKDGESIILGGLIQRVTHEVKTKVPGLGDIPLLGHLFSRTQTVEEEGEVLIIITPRILVDGISAVGVPLPGEK